MCAASWPMKTRMPSSSQALRGGAVAWSSPRRVAQVVQDLGDAAHAGAADADEVDVLDGVLHARATSFDLVGHARRGLRPGQRAGLAGHGQQRLACQAAAAAASAARRQLGLRQVQAAPCPAIHCALSRWCAVVLTISGTSTRGTPAAHSSLTVMAPARQTIRSQAASCAPCRR
jgi:hypothetical protein